MSDRSPPVADEPPGPPEFPQIEQQLIGMVLAKPALFEAVVDLCAPEHFVEESYGRIWGVLLEMWRRSVPVGFPNALEPIADDLGWPRAETGKMLVDLMHQPMIPSLQQARYLAETVRDVWGRREVWQLAQDMIMRTQGGLDNSAAKIIEEAEAKLYDVAVTGSADEERSFTFSEAVALGLEQAHAAADQRAAGQLMGVSSGISIVDKKLGGFRDTDLIVVASRPGMGKTAFSNRVAKAAAEKFKQDNPERPDWVYIFSLEMSADQLALRQVAAQARVSFERVRLGLCDPTELMALERAGQEIRDLPIRIDDTANNTVSAMRARVRRWSRRHGRVGLVIIDYLQLVGLSRAEKKEGGGNRVQEVSFITRALKALAKDLLLPILALSQLSREVEKRDDKRPQLSDLRESGTIEQDADLVAFLYREVYYLRQRPPAKKERESALDFQQRTVEWEVAVEAARHKAEFILAKNRHGSLGTMLLTFIENLMLFEDDSPGGAGGDGRYERERQLRMDIDDRIE